MCLGSFRPTKNPISPADDVRGIIATRESAPPVAVKQGVVRVSRVESQVIVGICIMPEQCSGVKDFLGLRSRSAQPSPSADDKKIFKKIPLLYQQRAISVIAPKVCIFTLYIFAFYL
jgi:hypothetical protein